MIFLKWLYLSLGLWILAAQGTLAQDTLSASTSFTVKKFTPLPGNGVLVTGTHIGFLTGSYLLLNKAWYSNYPKRSFHRFNDNREWNQMDKVGHFWTTYHLARASAASWKWAGMPPKQSVLFGTLTGLTYQAIIEIQDGYSAQWGFSWGDVGANIAGAAAFSTQEFFWKEQRIQFKLSYWGYNYGSDLIGRRNELFGKSFPEKLLKDYNSQTYWVSANLKSFFPKSNLPKWLNVALGYGSDGLLGGFENKWIDKLGNTINRSDISRIRQFYLSPDIDLTHIPTRNKLLKSVFFVFSIVKIPAPAIMLNSKGKWRMYALYY